MKEILKLGKLLLILLIAIPFLVVAGAVGIFIFCTQSNGQPYYLTD
jgi:type III secretory pathway component EscS